MRTSELVTTFMHSGRYWGPDVDEEMPEEVAADIAAQQEKYIANENERLAAVGGFINPNDPAYANAEAGQTPEDLNAANNQTPELQGTIGARNRRSRTVTTPQDVNPVVQPSERTEGSEEAEEAE